MSDRGEFGTSWLAIEGETNRLAQALLDWRHLNLRTDAIPVLLESGETLTAMRAILDLSYQSDGSLLKLAKAVELPPQIRHIIWVEAVAIKRISPEKKTGFEEAYIEEGNAAIAEGSISGAMWYSTVVTNRDFTGDERNFVEVGKLLKGWEFVGLQTFDQESVDVFVSLLEKSDWYNSIRQPCSRLCPNETTQCMHAAFSAAGGHDAVVMMGTPLQPLIADSTYLKSRRAEVQLIRTLRQPDFEIYHADIRKVSACLADHIEN